ncbi:MAG: enoyl-CoA hydratase/isomerase family protein [Deltaproteobacteria bacterium]|nr:enoyl-CoA hydratase/isomerase family protein [Deltaproteobacteria bacterium]
MKEPAVVFEKRGLVGIITLNRPDRKNTITAPMASEMRTILDAIGWDSDIAVFLLTGQGADFSTGTDADSFQSFKRREDRINHHAMASRIASLTQPIIAALDGAAFGQGLELALACDIRIASDRSRFAMTQINTGEMPFDGGTQRLPRLIGRMKALEMILYADIIDVQAAKEMGLVNRVVPHDSLLSEALKLAGDLTAKSPLALKYAKEAVLKGMDMTLAQGMRLEADLYFLLHTTDDRREGIEAFREKRSPKFTGK